MKNPHIIKTIQDTITISSLVNSRLHNEEKTTVWLNTENSLLNNKEPMELIFQGQIEKVIDIISKDKTINGSI